MKALLCLCPFLFFSHFVGAIGQNATVAFQSSPGTVKLAGRNSSISIIVDGSEWPAVLRAANDLANDFGLVTGTNGTVFLAGSKNSTVVAASTTVNTADWPLWNSSKAIGDDIVIIVGTLDRSLLIEGLVKGGKIKVEEINRKWEAFTSALVLSPIAGVSQALVIAGSDKRGSVYGLYDISEQIGVSPWYWFADVPPQRHDIIYALNTTKVQKSPSVKYRGFFINDEAPALTGWAKSKYPRSKYASSLGSEFYAHVFELLLRLRANYLWPAMWGSMFNVDDPRNQPLADEYGIVMGTSHTEPMMRATQEQSRFGQGPWQWNVNNASMYTFMAEGAKRAKPYESIFTMGVRGNHDTALNGGDAIQQLEGIFKAEREILNDLFGDQTKVPQVWTLYTEVQGYYDEDGLKVPDDITLLWADDNFGNIRRLPLANETKRAGGAGVYYHFDYVGSPRNYKWINTIELQRTWEQMYLAYQRNAKTIWIVNVGDIKPLEIPTSHFFDLAYDIDHYHAPNSTTWWLQQWARREFGQENAKDIADLVTTYSRLAGRRKFELVDMSTYSIINYEEGDRVLAEWQTLGREAQNLSDRLPDNAKAAFFEMVLHPVLAGGNVHEIAISSAKNQLYAFQGRSSANAMAEHVLDRWKYDHDLTDRYHKLLGGKWDHMMDQPHFYNNYWQQPMRQLSPQLQYIQAFDRSLSGDMGVSIDGSNASIPGDDQFHPNSGVSLTFPPLNPYGQRHWIDIFAQGSDGFSFNISTEPFVRLSQSSGTIFPIDNGTDIRIYVSIDWTNTPTGSGISRINITSSTDYGTQFSSPYLLVPYNNTRVPPEVTSGFVESDATIAMEAEHYTSIASATPSLTYTTIPNYGKTLSGVTLTDRNAPSLSTVTAPSLLYDFYTFTQTTETNPANISLIFSQSLNTNPKRPLRYALAIDDSPPSIVQYISDRPKGGMPFGWEKAVTDAAWVSTTKFALRQGKHVLRFWALEPGVVLLRIVVDLGGVRKSYLGPGESWRVGVSGGR